MSQVSKWRGIAGFTLHVLIGGMMLLIGLAKASGYAPAEKVAQMGLTDVVRMIGAGQIVTGLLLLHPRTLSLGILLASSYWGGAICLHMSHGDSYLIPAVLLVLSWIGAVLRNPVVIGSLQGCRGKSHCTNGTSCKTTDRVGATSTEGHNEVAA